jgi:hypothetical protein
MSTAGKVLTVLVALMALIWLVMAAGVAEYNRNGAAALEKIQKQVDELDNQVAKAKADLRGLVDQEYLQRHKTQEELTALQQRQAEVEKAKSQVLEIATRVKYQLETVSATLKQAQADVQQRQAEKEAETKAKADAEALVEKLKGENKESRDKLAGLQDQFRKTLQQNKEMVEKLRAQRGVQSRSASLVR